MLEVNFESGKGRVAIELPKKRGQQAKIVEHGGTQIKGEFADQAKKLVHASLGFMATGMRGFAGRSSALLDVQPESGELLADLVVQLAGNAAALQFLHLDQPAGKRAQFITCRFHFAKKAIFLLFRACDFRDVAKDDLNGGLTFVNERDAG